MTDRELKTRVRQALDMTMPPLPDDPDLADKVIGAHAKKQRLRQSRLLGLRVAAALAVMLLVVCSGLLMSDGSYIRLDRWQSEDEQLYYVQGERVTPPIDGTAEAAILHTENISLHTTSWDEVVAAIGTAPLAPTSLPDGWEVYQYMVDISVTLATFNATYQKAMPTEDDPDHIGYLVFTSNTFFDPDGPYVALEQNGAGELIPLDNGIEIYLTTNFNHTLALWVNGATSYVMSAPMPEDDFMRIIRSIYGLG